jgi:hypothetical protein
MSQFRLYQNIHFESQDIILEYFILTPQDEKDD